MEKNNYENLIANIPLNDQGKILKSGHMEVKEQAAAYWVVSWLHDKNGKPEMRFSYSDGTHKIWWDPNKKK